MVDLDSLAASISVDSIESYAHQLESFGYRVAGTLANRLARNWLETRFRSFGYNSVYTERFTADLGGNNTLCYNLIATKVGTTCPAHEIIFCAHFDAGEGSPAPDDNGSGTDAVLEIARALADVDTRMTCRFILFDAEEWGLYGSYHYAEAARQRGDRIVVVLNMDMIGHIENTDQARIYWDSDVSFAQLWQSLADSLPSVNINANLVAWRSSDHVPFLEAGYDALFIQEDEFSTHYHTSSDSTTYLNFDYLTRMARGTLAAGYFLSQTQSVPELLLSVQGGPPVAVYPNMSMPVTLTVVEYTGDVDPTGVYLHWSVEGAPWDSVRMANASDGFWEAGFPVLSCLDQIDYFFSARSIGQTRYTLGRADNPFRAYVATGEEVVFEDDFGEDLGWTEFGDATDGHWHRGWTTDYWGMPANDYDNNDVCLTTGKPFQMQDVDGGTTTAVSPGVFVDGRDAIVTYAWYYNNAGGPGVPYEDTFKVFIRRSGQSPHLVETAGSVEGVSEN